MAADSNTRDISTASNLSILLDCRDSSEAFFLPTLSEEGKILRLLMSATGNGLAPVNHYRRRQVSASAESACTVCFRPTDTVLMSIDSRDWFFCCLRHLLDRGLVLPLETAASATTTTTTTNPGKSEAMKKEIEAVKLEYEEKQRRKAELREKREKEGKAGAEESTATEEEEKKKKKKESSSGWFSMVNPFSSSPSAADSKTAPADGKKDGAGDRKDAAGDAAGKTVEPPREFALHRTMYQHRVNLKIQAAQQKSRDAQWATIQFPNVPTTK